MFAHHYVSKQRHSHFNCIDLLCTAQYHENIQYPGVHYGIGDDEDEYHRLVPGQWRQGVNMQDMEKVTAGNQMTNKKDYI